MMILESTGAYGLFPPTPVGDFTEYVLLEIICKNVTEPEMKEQQ